MSESIETKLWSDFDGTAVEIVKKRNPRNWSKYPLKGLVGYPDFLHGAQDEGMEIAGIVSRRPNMAVRRWATNRSIVDLGLLHFFHHPEQVVLAGSEWAKAEFVASQSETNPVALIEDKPHNVGPLLVATLLETALPEDGRFPITLGVVSSGNGRSAESLKRFKNGLGSLGDEVDMFDSRDGFNIVGQSFSMNVVALEPYSYAAGTDFAHRTLNPSR